MAQNIKRELVGGVWKTIAEEEVAGGDGSGDVVGPSSSTGHNLAAFANNTGKLLEDSGVPTPSAFAQTLLDDANAAASRSTLGLVIGTDVQAHDADLDTWAGKTPPSGAAVGTTDTQTLTGKRITKRVVTTNAPGATPSIDADVTDIRILTGLATAVTSMTTNLTGTPTDGQTLWVAFTDDGTARAITWGAKFEASGTVALPTTTVLGVRLDVGFVWNAVTSKWRCVAAV